MLPNHFWLQPSICNTSTPLGGWTPMLKSGCSLRFQQKRKMISSDFDSLVALNVTAQCLSAFDVADRPVLLAKLPQLDLSESIFKLHKEKPYQIPSPYRPLVSLFSRAVMFSYGCNRWLHFKKSEDIQYVNTVLYNASGTCYCYSNGYTIGLVY